MLASVAAALLLVLALGCGVAAQNGEPTQKEIAGRYAPVFHQALGDLPRSDYITNFDFDGDWLGTNNWAHASDEHFPLNGYVYYSLAETSTHYFIHYGVFHARDYKGGVTKGRIYSDLLYLGARVLSGGSSPKGRLAEAAIAHENDMEGALVVVDKASASVVYVETLHHNLFSHYVGDSSTAETVSLGPAPVSMPFAASTGRRPAGAFKLIGDHVELYVQPKGHGIEALDDAIEDPGHDHLVYSYSGVADDPAKAVDGRVGYALLPIASTLWPRARVREKNSTFASFKDYGAIEISVLSGGVPTERSVEVGEVASAFRGKVGGVNTARPPWGWMANDHRSDPRGLWFFDPARIVKRDFELPDSFSTSYLKLPFWAKQ